MNLRSSTGRPPLRMPDPVSEGLGYDWVAGLVDNNFAVQNSSLSLSRKPEWPFPRDRTHMACKAQHLQTTSGILAARHPFLGVRNVSDGHTAVSNLRRESLESPCEKVAVYNYTLNSRLFPIPADFLTASMGSPSPNTCRILKVSIPLHRLRRPNFLPQCDIGPDSSAQNASTTGSGRSFACQSRETEQKPGTASLLAHCWPNKSARPRTKSAYEIPRSPTTSAPHSSISLRSAVRDSDCSTDSAPSLPSWMRLQPQSESEILGQLIRSSQVMRNREVVEGTHRFPSRLRPIRRPSQRTPCTLDPNYEAHYSDRSKGSRL
nr:unnamed protein product [Spirometra erinaceieuropaei]